MSYRIGEFSNITGLSVKTLRFYDEQGLLKPGEVDQFTNYRYYNSENVSRAAAIDELKSCFFKLEEIKNILDNGITEEIIDKKQEEILKSVDELYVGYNQLQSYKDSLVEQKHITNNDVKVKSLNNLKKCA